MSKTHTIYRFEIIDKDISRQDLRSKLQLVTDDDYNGTNGPEYYINNVSCLDYDLANCRHKNTIETIEHVIVSNYSNYYYENLEFNVVEINDKIVISLSVNYYN